MKKDIDTRADINSLVNDFYTRVQTNDILSPIFTNIAHFAFETHIPVMIDFWEMVLLGGKAYKGNPMLKHIELDKSNPLDKKLFDEWLKVFNTTVDDTFEGEKADEAKKRANTMAILMLYKIEESKKKGFIQ